MITNNKLQLLQPLITEATKCTKCELHKNRINSVFHKGNINSPLVFLGESPGKTEGETGIPFCGKAGKLLDNMILSMGFQPHQVYVCNVVKCRPPNNRKPLPEEMEACKPFLTQQLQIVAPKILITLGATATEAILGVGEGITKRRGKWAEYQGIKVMPTFHPAALLRNSNWKVDCAADLAQVAVYMRENNITFSEEQ